MFLFVGQLLNSTTEKKPQTRKCVCLLTLIYKYIYTLHSCANEKPESKDNRCHHYDEEEEAAQGNEKSPIS